MGRGEEYVKRKHKRAERKRMRSASDGGEAELAAAKKRRRKGKRKITEGMCYSLPTAENPFLDEKEKAAFTLKHGKKVNPEASKEKRPKAVKSEPDNPSAIEKKAVKSEKTKKVFWPKGDVGKASITSLSDLRLPEVFKLAAKSLGINAVSKFQADVWKAALKGQGILGFSGEGLKRVTEEALRGDSGEGLRGISGEGLLAGYLLPAVVHLRAQAEGSKGQGPVVLVLVPNRGHGTKVIEACRKIRNGGIPLKAVNIHDGTRLQDQLEGLDNQVVDLVAATPGRLSQLNIVRGDLLSRVTFAVLDSADKMSERDLRQAVLLAESLRSDAQTLLFTSGYNAGVHEATRKWLKDPIERVIEEETPVATCAGIEQHFAVCGSDKKSQRVVKTILEVRESEQNFRAKSRILILVTTASSANETVEALAAAGLKAGQRHEDMRTEERLSVEDDFRAGKVRIVVTTSLTSPGLHASSVPFLIVRDLPATVAEYVALVGDVARSTSKGRVYSLITKEQAHLALELSELLQACAQPVDPKLAMMARAVKLVQEQQLKSGTKQLSDSSKDVGPADTSIGRLNGVNGLQSRSGKERQKGVNGLPKRGMNGVNGLSDGENRLSDGVNKLSDGEEDGLSDGVNGLSDEEESDDEATLEEDERLASAELGAEDNADELRALQEENELLMDELLAKVKGQEKGRRGNAKSEVRQTEDSLLGRGKRNRKPVTEKVTVNHGEGASGQIDELPVENAMLGRGKRKRRAAEAPVESIEDPTERKANGIAPEEEDFIGEADLEDDEGTLEEEERMEQAEGGSRKDELDRLQREGEMTIEEILAQYRNQR